MPDPDLDGPLAELPVSELVEFLTVLAGEDELGVVVRAHIHLEYQIEQFLNAALPAPAELGSLNYSTRVRVALACGLRPDLKPALKAVGTLRNKFAHEPGKELSLRDVETIKASLGPRERAILAKASRLRPDDASEIARGPLKVALSLYLAVVWAAMANERGRVVPGRPA